MGMTFEQARRALEQRLSPSSLRHSLAVAEEAGRLAAMYGVDVEHARLAGLLHDWCRDLDDGALVQAALDVGIEVTSVDLEVPYLLHAQVGACQLADAFPDVPGEVLRAVERHTVASPAMDPLDQVVYVADMIEPGRAFSGVKPLRELVGTTPLPELFAAAYATSLRHLVTSQKHIHPATVDAWNAIVDTSGGGR